MFDLNERLRTWREALLQREALQAGDVDELEAHLREEISRLVAKGLTEEEAFGVALHRLGHGDMLDAEFRKVNGGLIWGKRLQWMLAGYLLITLFGRMILASAEVFTSIAAAGGMKDPLAVAVYASVSVLCVVALLCIVARRIRCGATDTANRWHAWTRSWLGSATIVAIVLPVVLGIWVLQFAHRILLIALSFSHAEPWTLATSGLLIGFAESVLLPLAVLVLMIWIDRRNPGPAAS